MINLGPYSGKKCLMSPSFDRILDPLCLTAILEWVAVPFSLLLWRLPVRIVSLFGSPSVRLFNICLPLMNILIVLFMHLNSCIFIFLFTTPPFSSLFVVINLPLPTNGYSFSSFRNFLVLFSFLTTSTFAPNKI